MNKVIKSCLTAKALAFSSLLMCNSANAAISWVEGGSVNQATVNTDLNGANNGISTLSLNGGVATDSITLSAATGRLNDDLTLVSHNSGDNFTVSLAVSYFDASAGTVNPLAVEWALNSSNFARLSRLDFNLPVDTVFAEGDILSVNANFSHFWDSPQGVGGANRNLSTSYRVAIGFINNNVEFEQIVRGNNINLAEVDGAMSQIIETLENGTNTPIIPDSSDTFSDLGNQGLTLLESRNDADVSSAEVSGYTFNLTAQAGGAGALQSGDVFRFTFDGNLLPDAQLVPEPSSILLAALMPIFAVFYRRRR